MFAVALNAPPGARRTSDELVRKSRANARVQLVHLPFSAVQYSGRHV
jgi:hypothetical protein